MLYFENIEKLEGLDMEEKKEASLERSLNLFDAIAIVAGSMIGSGIFIVSADIARQVNSSLMLLLVWIVAGVMTLIAGLCYAEYSASIPEAGGQYVYLKKVWGRFAGFLYGWVSFLVIQTGTIAAVAVAFAKFSGVLFPQISSNIKLISFHGISVSSLQALAILLIVILTYFNIRGVKDGVIIQNIFTSAKILALVGMILCGIFLGFNPHIFTENITNFARPENISISSAIAVAMVGALFSADSWYNVTLIASEIKNPERNLPLSLFFGIGGVVLIYVLVNVIYLGALPLDAIKHAPEDIVGAAFMGEIFGVWGKIIIAVIIVIAALGCVNGVILSGARIYYAMAKDGLFFNYLAELNKNHVPGNALILQGIWASFLVLTGSYSDLLDYVIFVALLFYILTIGGLVYFRKKYPDINRPYKAILYPYLPLAYCFMATFICINLLIHKSQYTIPGLVLVGIGALVYLFRFKLREKK